MADRISKEQRSKNMAQIRSKDTKPEQRVRSRLHRDGFRFRKNVTSLPGKPDIVLSKYKTVIMVNGCFWHHHENCKYAHTPKSNTEFWQMKFQRNIENDKAKIHQLENMGWKVLTVWECELKNNFEPTILSLEEEIKKGA